MGNDARTIGAFHMNRIAEMQPEWSAVLSLGDDRAYRSWREAKLSGYPRSAEEVTVEICDLAAPTPAETAAIIAACRRANMCIYRSVRDQQDIRATRGALAAFARHFGLSDFETHRSAEADGIVALEVAAEGGRLGYIPYTNRPIGWHTDGYYNYHGRARMVRAMLLHCVHSARQGGENGLLDHEIAYIRLRDEDPNYVAALMHPGAMSIPANEETDGTVRTENTGPVFAPDVDTGALTMRYTARKRNIRWREDATTQAAARTLEGVLNGDPLIMRVRLGPGDGVICNNVLHDRSRFDDGSHPEPGRLLYRIRSYDRIRAAAFAPELE